MHAAVSQGCDWPWGYSLEPSFVLLPLPFLKRRALWKRGSFTISKVYREKKKDKSSKSSCWLKSEMLQKNAALPSGTWSHWKPMCSGEMRAAFPRQVAGLVSCLGLPRAAAGTGEKEGARGWEGGQSCSFFQQAGLWCCAGIANQLGSWLWSPDAENSPWTIGHCSPLPGTRAQVRGKNSLHAFSKFPDKS